MSAESAAHITAENLRRDELRLGEYSDFARVRIRAKARENKQSFTMLRILPCPALDRLESKLNPRAILNRVMDDLIRDGFSVSHMGSGIIYVDWSRALHDLQSRTAPSVPDRVSADDVRKKEYEASVRRKMDLYQLMQKSTALRHPPGSGGAGPSDSRY